jgi:hypothetical protein
VMNTPFLAFWPRNAPTNFWISGRCTVSFQRLACI